MIKNSHTFGKNVTKPQGAVLTHIVYFGL